MSGRKGAGVAGGRDSWWDDGVPAGPAPEDSAPAARSPADVGNTGKLTSGPVEPEVIELGQRPAVDVDGAELSTPDNQGGPPRQRPGMRHRLVLAGLGLIAVGFAGGMAVQHSRALDPAPAPSPSIAAVPENAAPSMVWHCEPYYYDPGQRGDTMTTCPADGVITTIMGSAITLRTVDGGRLTVFFNSASAIIGAETIDDLHQGQRIWVLATPVRGRLVAERITVE